MFIETVIALKLVRVVTTLVATHEKPLSQSIYSHIDFIASIAGCSQTTSYPIARVLRRPWHRPDLVIANERVEGRKYVN